ncbi:MAG: DNA polymerase III subunit alpha [Deltaproteobacteria bacterium]|nr:DNA polymerase III subunit alpha [Deltaproteobacteria bacterium]
MADFVHLHVHTQYSLLDGALRVKPESDRPIELRSDLAHRVKRMGMPAVAMTDHANMFGAITFYKACKEAGIKAILGCELNVARTAGMQGKSAEASPLDHLVLLAASEKGYKNLVRLVSLAQIEPASTLGPSTTLDRIAESSEDLVMLTGCMGGLVAQTMLNSGPERAVAQLERLMEFMPRERLFIELQNHGFPEQPILNEMLIETSNKLDLPIVATNDVHFAEKADGDAHLMLTCVAANCSYDDAKDAHHGSAEMYLKSPEEMTELFKHRPDAISNTLLISEMCTGWKLKLGQPMLPTFPLPEGQDAESYFMQVARDGLKARFEEFQRIGFKFDPQQYIDRLEHELKVIVGMKFPGYFLIVWDFIRFAKENGIPVGPGRGSGAGSLVAYSMRITDLDPMPYDLLFERFLNPERISMPDFDVDFCMDRREEVIKYVSRRYGENSVGQIATFHEMKARSVIKDVARARKVSSQDSQKLANLVPNLGQGKTATIAQALEMEPKLQAIVDEGGINSEVVLAAQKLEGLTRHVGMHAAGVVISEGPLWDHVPCIKQNDLLVTQYYMSDVEQAGLVKFDFLGLRTLTVIDIAARLVNLRPERQGQKFDINTIPMDDAVTFALLQSGETTGVFQLESSGMQELFKRLRPDRFEDIVAAVALYRPGPLGSGMDKDFVACKHGRQPIKKMHALIDDVLKPTYGVIVYQEQVMQIARQMAGYTLGGADLLRRAMGKKKKEEMDKQRSTFVSGAVGNGVTEEKATEIFDLVAKFAEYGFNKSHSAGYGLICYQTAYLKARFPAEFLCALMTADRERTEKVVRFIAEGRAMGVKILPPDINDSDTGFKVVYASPAGDYRAPRGSRVTDKYQPQIRFGLGAVRGVGDAALESVFEARKQGPFKDLFDFASRVDARKINKGALEALVQCGAFDTTLAASRVTRAQAFGAIDTALERGRSASKDRERGQATLFGMFEAAAPVTTTKTEYPTVPPWDLRETCVREKQALGFYVSAHPLDRYGKELDRFQLASAASLPDADMWAKVRVAGMVEGYREKIFKGSGNAQKTAFFDLEDKTGRVTVRVKEQLIDAAAPVLTSGDPVVVSGTIRFPEREEGSEDVEAPREPTLLLDKVALLASLVQAETKAVTIRLRSQETTAADVTTLGGVLRDAPGDCPVTLVLEMPTGAEVSLALSPELRVEAGDRLFSALERQFGRQVAELRL